MAKIGFIGLGNMGGPMAANLIAAGNDVKVFDLSAEAMNTLAEAGATVAESAADAVVDADFVISMLPNSKHVQNLYCGENGIGDAIAQSALVIDCSTIDAKIARELAVELNKKGVRFVDAPVSGGTAGAKSGTLTFICGGDAADIEEAREILGQMGKNVFRAGEHGSGQVAKICNNMMLAISMAGTSEALQLGKANGLDPKVLSEIMLQSSGRNWTLEVYNPCPYVLEGVPSSNNYEGGFQVDLMSKDLGLAMDTAQNAGSNTPLGKLVQSMYSEHSGNGFGKKDFSSIFTYFEPKRS